MIEHDFFIWRFKIDADPVVTEFFEIHSDNEDSIVSALTFRKHPEV